MACRSDPIRQVQKLMCSARASDIILVAEFQEDFAQRFLAHCGSGAAK